MISFPWIGTVLSISLILAAPACAREAPEAMLQASVTLILQSGEPGAPSETITLRSAAGKAPDVELQRVFAGGRPDIHASEIEPQEFAAIWNAVEAARLRAWLPSEAADAADFGEQRLRITWRPRGISAPQVHEVAWTRPLQNGEGYQALCRAVATVLKQHIKEKSLYLP